MVLIIEALDDEFINSFVGFVDEAGYEHIKKVRLLIARVLKSTEMMCCV
ncbi:hypothetical protein M2141_002099 [Lachnospiraceae bacterium PH5-48]